MTGEPASRSAVVLSLLVILMCPDTSAQAAGEADQEARWEYSHPLAFKWLRRRAFGPAARQFKLAHEARPDLAGPLAGWSFAECRAGNLDAARAHVPSAAAIDPDQPLLHVARACLAEADGDFAAAEAEYEIAEQLSSLPLFGSYKTVFLLHQGHYDAASRHLDELERSAPSGSSSDSIAAQCFLALGDVEMGALLSEGVRSTGRSSRSGQALITLVALAEQHLVGAPASGYRYFVPPDGTSDRTLLLRAEVQRRLGNLDDAEALVGRRKREPREPVGASILARVAADLGSYDQARDLLDEASRSWPMHASVLISEAWLALLQGDRDAAERALQCAQSVGVPAWDHAVEGDVEWLLRRLPQ